ncbi:hypothetical protein TNCV_2871881 [Trichonephila clavipes]|nr:hypothetical protein TNCV_2871881 [Trichonephila clavipes]
MTSITNWSERTDSTVTLTTTTGLGASPSQVTTGDELIAEKSDLFREAIRARNVYAAWARKLTNAKPNDPKLQEYHQEVTKAEPEVENGSGPSSPPPLPARVKGGKRSVDSEGFAPPSSLLGKLALPARPPTFPTPPSATSVEDARLEGRRGNGFFATSRVAGSGRGARGD